MREDGGRKKRYKTKKKRKTEKIYEIKIINSQQSDQREITYRLQQRVLLGQSDKMQIAVRMF